VHDVLSALNNKRPNIVMEATGGKFFKECYQLLDREGRLIVYGASSFTPK